MKKRILLVEDEAIIALAEIRFLESAGYAVVHANSGEAALEKLSPDIDLVLMDINLGPGMLGTEAAALMLEKREVPIIFLTSHSSEEMVKKVRDITRYGYVVKNSGNFVLQSSIEMAFELFEAHAQERQTVASFQEAERIARFGHWRMSKDRRRFLLSKGATEICGLDDPYIDVDAYQALVVPEDRPARDRALGRTLKTGGKYDTQYRIRRPRDGVVVWLHSTAQATGSGEIEFGVLRDISDRKEIEEKKEATALRLKRAMEKIRANGHYFKTLFAGNGAAMLMIDPGDGRIVDANRAASVFYGWSLPRLRRMRITDINTLPAEKTSGEITAAETSRRSGFFFKHRRADGSIRDVVVLSNPIEIDGKIYLHSIISDLYAPQYAEFEQARRYWQLAEHSGAVVWTLDAKTGKLAYISPSVEKIFGYTVERAKELGMEGLLTPASCNKAIEELAERAIAVYGGDRSAYEPKVGFFRQYRADGSIADIELTTTVVTDTDREIREVVGMSRDITGRLAMEKELNKLQSANTRLLQEVQYRVKNSLLVIADLLRLEESTITESTARTALEDARNRISSLSKLYDKLFQFPDYRSVPVRSFVEDLVATIQAEYPELVAKIDVYTDYFSMNIQQLFLMGLIVEELVTNSVKHAFPSGNPGNIHITVLEYVQNQVELIVSDDGVGMEVGDASPSGVGLALVEEVARMLSARMERRLGNGTTHKIRFPILQPIPGQG